MVAKVFFSFVFNLKLLLKIYLLHCRFSYVWEWTEIYGQHSRACSQSRYIELSLLQRTNACFPSDVDVKEARKVASYALKVALRGSTNKIVTIKRVSDEPYKIKLGLLNIALVANKEKYLPLTYLNIEHDNILPSFIKYALPLIGNDSKKEENGLYKSFKL